MNEPESPYPGHRFPREIVSHAVWLYYRFALSLRDVEDLLAERGLAVSYETIRQWSRKFGLDYARRLKRKQGKLGDHWFLDEVFVKVQGKQQPLWRAVDQDGDTIDILVQSRRNRGAAKRFFLKLLKAQDTWPNRLVTDKLRSYGAAHREIMPSVPHDTRRWANNRAEASHEAVRFRERQMRGFKSGRHAQRFLSVYSVVGNLFRVGRQKVSAENYKILRNRAFKTWKQVSCAS
jgi:putative transposase